MDPHVSGKTVFSSNQSETLEWWKHEHKVGNFIILFTTTQIALIKLSLDHQIGFLLWMIEAHKDTNLPKNRSERTLTQNHSSHQHFQSKILGILIRKRHWWLFWNVFSWRLDKQKRTSIWKIHFSPKNACSFHPVKMNMCIFFQSKIRNLLVWKSNFSAHWTRLWAL